MKANAQRNQVPFFLSFVRVPMRDDRSASLQLPGVSVFLIVYNLIQLLCAFVHVQCHADLIEKIQLLFNDVRCLTFAARRVLRRAIVLQSFFNFSSGTQWATQPLILLLFLVTISSALGQRNSGNSGTWCGGNLLFVIKLPGPYGVNLTRCIRECYFATQPALVFVRSARQTHALLNNLVLLINAFQPASFVYNLLAP